MRTHSNGTILMLWKTFSEDWIKAAIQKSHHFYKLFWKNEILKIVSILTHNLSNSLGIIHFIGKLDYLQMNMLLISWFHRPNLSWLWWMMDEIKEWKKCWIFLFILPEKCQRFFYWKKNYFKSRMRVLEWDLHFSFSQNKICLEKVKNPTFEFDKISWKIKYFPKSKKTCKKNLKSKTNRIFFQIKRIEIFKIDFFVVFEKILGVFFTSVWTKNPDFKAKLPCFFYLRENNGLRFEFYTLWPKTKIFQPVISDLL